MCPARVVRSGFAQGSLRVFVDDVIAPHGRTGDSGRQQWPRATKPCVLIMCTICSLSVKTGFGLTSFNEVIVVPPTRVGALFWAHPGPFRAPAPDDPAACTVAAYLRGLEDHRAPLPVFELSQVSSPQPPPPPPPTHPYTYTHTHTHTRARARTLPPPTHPHTHTHHHHHCLSLHAEQV